MSFRPFGTKIDFYSPLPPDECRRRLEAKFVPRWERPADLRARGKFIGHILVMWLGAFDWINRSSEPKLVAKLRPEMAGTRIVGRLIPGIQFVLFLVPMTVGALWGSVALIIYRPDHPPADPIIYTAVKAITALIPIGIALGIWWFASNEGKSGRPLISFLKRTLCVDGGTSKKTI
jgi:hypothetical protein